MGHERELLAAGDPDYVTLLRGTTLHRAWQEALDGWEDAPAGGKEAVVWSVARMRDQFLAAVADVDDPEERETLAAVFYAEVRCRWVQLNLRTGYQLQCGRADRALHCESGMLSALLGQVETLLHPADVARLTATLARPAAAREEERRGTPEGGGGVEEDGGADASRLRAELDDLRRLFAEEQEGRARAESEAVRAAEDRRTLASRLGTADADQIARQVLDLRARLNALEELQGMLTGLERTSALVNF